MLLGQPICGVLTDRSSRNGRRVRYDELIDRANIWDVHGIAVRVAALDDVIALKKWPGRTTKHV